MNQTSSELLKSFRVHNLFLSNIEYADPIVWQERDSIE